jgi:hypothetical protein
MNELPKLNMDRSETGCCPKFNPEAWNEKVFRFDDLIFAKAKTRSFFYMPLNMGKVMSSVMSIINKAQAEVPDRYLTLSHDVSPWRCEHYFLVTKEVKGMEMTKFSGTFLTKVFEGGFKEIPNWMKEMDVYVKSQGKETKKIYSFYTTCPKCAKHYGKNYVVLFVQV